MICSRLSWLLAVGSALLAAGGGAGQAQQQGAPVELVEPDIEGEVPPVMLDETEGDASVQGGDVPQLLTSLRRAQESLQQGHQPAAMRALMQAEEQLDEAANDEPELHPWQQLDRALQEAMKALAVDNVRYAQIALQRVMGPLEGDGVAANRGVEGGGQQTAASPLASLPMDDLLGAEVMNGRGETIAEVTDVVRARGGDGELHAILQVGGVLGLGDKSVALPLTSFQVTGDDKIVLPQTTEDQLAEMPVYNEGQYEQAR